MAIIRVAQLKGQALAYTIARLQGKQVLHRPNIGGKNMRGYWVRCDWRTMVSLATYLSQPRVSALKRTYKLRVEWHSATNTHIATATMYGTGATATANAKTLDCACLRAILRVKGFKEFEVPEGVPND